MADAEVDSLGNLIFENRYLMTNPSQLDYTSAKASLANVPNAKFLEKALAAGLAKDTLENATDAGFAAVDFTLPGSSTARNLAERFGEVVNVKDEGAGSGDVAADTAAIDRAYARGIARGTPHLYFPGGAQYFYNGSLLCTTSRVRFFSEGAALKFYGAGQIKLGTDAAAPGYVEIIGLKFDTDGSSTAAPIDIYNAGRVYMDGCEWRFVKGDCITLERGTLILKSSESYILPGTGGSLVKAVVPAGGRSALFIHSGTYSGEKGGSQFMVDHSGAGTFDGCVLLGLNASDYAGVLHSAPAAGGKLSNCMAYASLLDQVDQSAFKFAPAAGATLGDVDICGNTLNGYVASAKTGALISLDLSTGAAHDDVAFRVQGNMFKNARDRVVEVLGGTFETVAINGNHATDYGRRSNAGSRFAYIKGSFARLELADNSGRTSRIRDYDVEFDGVTATRSKVEGNAFSAALAPTIAEFNKTSFHSARERLTGPRTYYVRTDGSDGNCGRVDSGAGAFLTIQAAYDEVAARLDLNGQTATIKLGDGTYAAGLIASLMPIGGGTIQIQGNAVTPANVVVSTTSADAFRVAVATNTAFVVRDLQPQTTTSGYGLSCQARALLQYTNLVFGACASGHVLATGMGAVVSASGAYTIAGGAPTHVSSQYQAQVILTGRAITFSGTPAFASAFAYADRLSLIRADAATFTGSATGNRYAVFGNSEIYTNGGGASFLPGSASGSTASGGQYL